MNAIETPWPDRVLILRGHFDWTLSMTDAELATADAFKLPKRRDEWLLSRLAAKQLALQLGLADDPRAVTVDRPYLTIDGRRSEWLVSLSHSMPYAGAMIGREPVGLDVQVVREFAEWSAHLFMTDGEAEEMRRCSIEHRILHFWCAKESAWKQRSEEFATMKQLPLRLIEGRPTGLRFDAAETVAIGELIVAVTPPTS
jgi:phosphopantetheinyl transferase